MDRTVLDMLMECRTSDGDAYEGEAAEWERLMKAREEEASREAAAMADGLEYP